MRERWESQDADTIKKPIHACMLRQTRKISRGGGENEETCGAKEVNAMVVIEKGKRRRRRRRRKMYFFFFFRKK